ncbi:MAG: hypothetical protein AMXMBFR84_11900 [Candidatus Hydrogenedentota bacterium]
MIVQCCDCKRIRLNGNWKRFHVPVPSTTLVSHSYCPECLDKALLEIDAYHHSHGCGSKTHAA